MSNRILQSGEFLREVAEHVMEVITDNDLYRHIRFQRPGTMCMHFDLITWPGHLCYTGDMGTFVFRRVPDMFAFFRIDHVTGDKLTINKSYWAEKLIAVESNGRHGQSAVEFSEARFREVINEYRVRWIRDAKEYGSLDKAHRRALWKAVDDDVLNQLDDGEHMVKQRANDFSWAAGERYPTYLFEDLWEHDFTEYTHSFVWCCYALAWGIQKYDERAPAAV